MVRDRRCRCVWLLALLLVLAAPGCVGMREIQVWIPDLLSARVAGVRLWTMPAGERVYRKQAELRLGGLTRQDDALEIEYVITDRDVGADLPLSAPVTFDPGLPGGARVDFQVFLTNGSGRLRVSTWNAAGESPLSREAYAYTL